jgi:hypothetical protein
MRSSAETEMEASNYTSLKALSMPGSGCSDRGYYRRRFHWRLLAEAGWRQINYFPAKGCILSWRGCSHERFRGDFIGGWVLMRF